MEMNAKSLSHKSGEKQNKSVNNQQILALLTSTQKLVHQNKSVYRSILNQDPTFNFDLYNPKSCFGLPIELEKQLRLKQIDQLLDQKAYLCQKKQQVIFKKQFGPKEYQENKIVKIDNQFTYSNLKQIINSLPPPNSVSCEQRVQEIDKMVKKLKSKVDIEIGRQKLEIRKNKNTSEIGHVPYKKYSKLQYLYHELRIELDQQINKNLKLELMYQDKNKQLIQLNSREQQLKAKICKLQQRLKQVQDKYAVTQHDLKCKERQMNSHTQYSYQCTNDLDNFQIIIMDKNSNQRKCLRTNKNVKEIVKYLQSGYTHDTQTINENQCQQIPSISSIKQNQKRSYKKSKSENKLKDHYYKANFEYKKHQINSIYSQVVIPQIIKISKAAHKIMPEENELAVKCGHKFKRTNKKQRWSNTNVNSLNYQNIEIRQFDCV